MALSTFWLTVLKMVFNVIAFALNTFLFHKIVITRKHLDTHFDKHWWIVWSSLSLTHILCSSCMFAQDILTLIIDKYFKSSEVMISIQTRVILLSIILNLLHMFSIMINDFKFTLNPKTSSKENIFFVILSWMSTSIVAILLIFVENESDITKLMSIVFVTSDGILTAIYTVIYYRIRGRFRKAEKTCHLLDNRMERLHFIGATLTLSFVAFTIPFPLERLAWNQNGIASFICTAFNSISHGVISLGWLYYKHKLESMTRLNHLKN